MLVKLVININNCGFLLYNLLLIKIRFIRYLKWDITNIYVWKWNIFFRSKLRIFNWFSNRPIFRALYDFHGQGWLFIVNHRWEDKQKFLTRWYRLYYYGAITIITTIICKSCGFFYNSWVPKTCIFMEMKTDSFQSNTLLIITDNVLLC